MNCEYKLRVAEGFIQTEGTLVPLTIDNEPKEVITYSEFRRRKGNVTAGTLVTEVKPGDLFVTQEWASPKKVVAAEERWREQPELAKLVPVYLGLFGERRVMGAGDGTHRIVTAKLNGDRVNAFIVGELPSKIRLIPINQYIRANSDYFINSIQSK